MRSKLIHNTLRYTVVLFGVALFLSITFSLAQAQELISCWQFEEGTGVTAHDYVSNNDGTLIDDPTWSAGLVGTALAFDGTGIPYGDRELRDMVEVDHSPSLNLGNSTDSFTIEAMFNTDNVFPSDPKNLLNDSGTIIGKDNGRERYPFQIGVGFFDELATNQGYFQVHLGGGVNVTISTQTAVNDGSWHHLAAVRNRSEGKIQLYLDGVMVSEAEENLGSVDNADNISIGCGSDSPIGSNLCHQRPYIGLIDEVAIYNGALSAGEIQQHSANALAGNSNCLKILNCIGFEPPLAGGPVTVKKNRVLPFKATLVDQSGNTITNTSILSPPVIEVIFDSGIAPAEDVTDQALTAGQGTEGNQFEYGTDKWQFNLQTKNYTASGTYTASIKSGDTSEYVIDSSCVGIFVIE